MGGVISGSRRLAAKLMRDVPAEEIAIFEMAKDIHANHSTNTWRQAFAAASGATWRAKNFDMNARLTVLNIYLEALHSGSGVQLYMRRLRASTTHPSYWGTDEGLQDDGWRQAKSWL